MKSKNIQTQVTNYILNTKLIKYIRKKKQINPTNEMTMFSVFLTSIKYLVIKDGAKK